MSFIALCAYQPLDLSHLTDIMAIERRVSARPWSASVMKDALMRAHTQVWGLVVESTKQLIGFGIISVVADEAELLLIAIDQPFQRQGLGTGMLSFLMLQAQRHHAKQLYLEAGCQNDAAKALYLRQGFQLNYIRSCYYPPLESGECAEDAWVMSASLAG